MAIAKLELNKLPQGREQVWSWQQNALWLLSTLLGLKEDTFLETFKVKICSWKCYTKDSKRTPHSAMVYWLPNLNISDPVWKNS